MALNSSALRPAARPSGIIDLVSRRSLRISARFEAAGLVTSGTNPQRDLVEIVELKNHPFFIGVQFHPEFKSKPLHPHPVFDGFVAAALAHARGTTKTGKAERSRA